MRGVQKLLAQGDDAEAAPKTAPAPAPVVAAPIAAAPNMAALIAIRDTLIEALAEDSRVHI